MPFNLSALGAELDQARQSRSSSGLSSAIGPCVGAVSIPTSQRKAVGDRTTVKVQEVASSPESQRLASISAPRPTAIPRADLLMNEQNEEGMERALRDRTTGSNGVSSDVSKQKKGSGAYENQVEAEVEMEMEHEEKPYPLCLLCLTRPPSAVLLPCCHLNLCHLCAPLLIEKHRPPPPADTSPLSIPSTISASSASTSAAIPPHPVPEYTRTPYNVLLFRAIANHPKSRALAMGGYIAPKKGYLGGEMDGCDLVEMTLTDGVEEEEEEEEEKDQDCKMDQGMTAAERVREKERRTGLRVERKREHEHEGRVVLSALSGSGGDDSSSRGGGAVCLICRQGVKGWLRVYTG
ncbi:hypothetical protein IAU59_002429 [Kwoniella sp. CBS 9459]